MGEFLLVETPSAGRGQGKTGLPRATMIAGDSHSEFFESFVESRVSSDRMDGYDESEREAISILLTFGNRRCCNLSRHIDFFMPASFLSISLGEILQCWFEIYPAIEKPTELAQSIFASGRERLWLHLEFLAWMQALEGLQRALPNQILRPIKPKRGKFPDLRERMDALTSLLPASLRAYILDEDIVPKSWIDTRHYYTHWIEDGRDGVLDNTGLYDANVRSKHLMVALYLILAGVPLESFLEAYRGASGMAQELQTRKAALAHKLNPNSSAGLIMAVRKASESQDVSENSSQDESPDDSETPM